MTSGTVLSIDTAYGMQPGSSSSVIQEWQTHPDGRHFLLNQWSGRVGFDELRKQVSKFVNSGRVGAIVVEDTGLGNALLPELRRRSGAGVHPIVPVGSKLERLLQVIDIVKAGLVFLPSDAEWVPAFLEEMEDFPKGWSDDSVDAMTQFLAWAKRNPPPARPAPRGIGVAMNRHGRLPPLPQVNPFGRTPGTPFATVWSPRRTRW
jgi:predicted phage terminase large subunit-like protein